MHPQPITLVAVASSLGGFSKVWNGAGDGTSHSRPSAPSQGLAGAGSGSGAGSGAGKESGKPLAVADRVGIAWVELSTGRFFAAEFPRWQLADQLARIRPAECLIAEGAASGFPRNRDLMVTTRPDWAFGQETAVTALTRHFRTQSLEGFGFTDADTLA